MKSPCIGTCIYDVKGKYCTGCFRDSEDVQNWPTMDDSEKREALKRCKTNRRKGRHGRVERS